MSHPALVEFDNVSDLWNKFKPIPQFLPRYKPIGVPNIKPDPKYTSKGFVYVPRNSPQWDDLYSVFKGKGYGLDFSVIGYVDQIGKIEFSVNQGDHWVWTPEEITDEYYPPQFENYGSYTADEGWNKTEINQNGSGYAPGTKPSWIRKRYIYGVLNENGSGSNVSPTDSDLEAYVKVLAAALHDTWAEGKTEFGYEVQFLSVAFNTVHFKSQSVRYKNFEKPQLFENVAKIMDDLSIFKQILNVAIGTGTGSRQQIWDSYWLGNILNPLFILTSDFIRTTGSYLKMMKSDDLHIYPMDLHYLNPKQMLRVESPFIPPPLYLTPVETSPSWWQNWEMDFSLIARFLMLTTDELVAILILGVPVTFFSLRKRSFAIPILYFSTTLFSKLLYATIMDKASENQKFTQGVYDFLVWTGAVKRDFKEATSVIRKVFIVSSIATIGISGLTFLGTHLPVIAPYTFIINVGIFGFTAIYDTFEIIYNFYLPKIF